MKVPEWLDVYGDMKYRGDCPPESAEQITFFNKLRSEYSDSFGMIAIHPRNEGKRTYGQTARHKAEGMTSGAPDIVIPGWPAFLCELKRQDHTKSTWQKGQLEYLKTARRYGSFVCVAFGWKGAWEAFKEWESDQ